MSARRRAFRLSAYVSAAVLVCSAAVDSPSHRNAQAGAMPLPPVGTLPYGVGIPGLIRWPGLLGGANPAERWTLPGPGDGRSGEDGPGGDGKDDQGRQGGEDEQSRKASAALTRALAPLAAGGAGLSVAVFDSTTGRSGLYGRGAYDTASIVKVDILTTLLLQAQRAGRNLTGGERGYAAAMIERSDNTAATALWRRIGGAHGLNASNARLGLRGTRGGGGHWWGLTRTTAADQLTLLRAVFGRKSVLTGSRRKYLAQLMGHVEPDQAWGVSAAADGAAGSALKNGWLMRTDSGMWDVNSIGQVAYGGHTMLVVVLSNDNASQEAGITLVQRAAQIAVRTVDSG